MREFKRQHKLENQALPITISYAMGLYVKTEKAYHFIIDKHS